MGEVQHREGHRGLHQEGVRQEVQPDVALHRRPQLRLLCDPRNEALHLLLPRPGRDPPLQVWLMRRTTGAHRGEEGDIEERRLRHNRGTSSSGRAPITVLSGNPWRAMGHVCSSWSKDAHLFITETTKTAV